MTNKACDHRIIGEPSTMYLGRCRVCGYSIDPSNPNCTCSCHRPDGEDFCTCACVIHYGTHKDDYKIMTENQ